MSALALALALAAGAFLRATADAPPTEAACAAWPPRFGSARAPIRIDVFLDPVVPGAIAAWIRARELVSELGGEASARLIVVVGAADPAARPEEQRLREWTMATGTLAGAEASLREVDRASWTAVATLLGRPDQRAALEKELDLRPVPAQERCAAPRITEATARLAELPRRDQGGGRAPVFSVWTEQTGDIAVEWDLGARRLRAEVALARQELRSGRPRPPAHLPDPPRAFPRRERPRVPGGVRIGDLGAPHHVLVYLPSEQRYDAEQAKLPAILAARRAFPGALELQVVAAGSRPEAAELRRRLCGATAAGLEMEYLLALAGMAPAAPDLESRLDAIARRDGCAPVAEEDNERGTHLDGQGQGLNQSELEAFDERMAADAARSRLAWFLRPTRPR